MRDAFKYASDIHELVGKTPDDKLKLFLDIRLLDPHVKTTYAAVLKDLSSLMDSSLIDEAILKDMVEKANGQGGEYNRRIAKGVPAVVGRDGKLVFLVKRFGESVEIKPDEKGSVNFANIRFFDNILPGQHVCRVYAPKNGVPGKDVFGKTIPAINGKPARYKIDKTLGLVSAPGEFRDDYQLLEAKEAGYLVDQGGDVKISNELKVSGDLDYRLGSIDFVGQVSISGDVNAGFKVKAAKDVTIGGSVNKASLESVSGKVEVKGSVFGGDGSKVIAGGEVVINNTFHAEVEAVGNIMIKKDCLESTLRTHGVVYVPNGHLVGGRVMTPCGLEVAMLGSNKNKTTEIFLCSDVETTKEYSEIVSSLANHEKAMTLIALHLGPYAQDSNKIDRLKGDYRLKMRELHTKLSALTKSKGKLEQRQKDMLAGGRWGAELKVNVLKKMYSGVEIKAGDKVFKIDGELDGPVSIEYLVADEIFRQAELKPLECVLS